LLDTFKGCLLPFLSVVTHAKCIDVDSLNTDLIVGELRVRGYADADGLQLPSLGWEVTSCTLGQNTCR